MIFKVGDKLIRHTEIGKGDIFEVMTIRESDYENSYFGTYMRKGGTRLINIRLPQNFIEDKFILEDKRCDAIKERQISLENLLK